jgi:hypothetical protein
LKNGIIINAPPFWPFFPISQRILWPGLGAVKLELLSLTTFWIKVLPDLVSRQGGILPGSLKLIPHLNREAREN